MNHEKMKILLITPPLTQLNTPYPATAYLKGFLKGKGYEVHQCDLGIELINKLFTGRNLERVFDQASLTFTPKTKSNLLSIYGNRRQYLSTIDAAMRFLRNEDTTLSTRICNSNFFPEASRFKNTADLDWAFGTLGFTDRARYLATLYLEDLTDFIRECINPFFELGRYAEHLSLLAPDFGPIDKAVSSGENIIDSLMLEILDETVKRTSPEVVGFSIPFPGNLYGAVKCSQFLKKQYSSVPIVWGGGYVNTELRELSDPRVFDYTDYIVFDEGELPLLRLLEYLEGKTSGLIRTKLRSGETIQTIGPDNTNQIPFADTGTPDYSGLPLHQYISLIETANPMHKLWSDGRWNKLTLARGCYWAKCAFCDTSLPYIKCYEPASASLTADRMEAVIGQTGTSGFHFVDEAAPPKILRELSEEILKRNLVVSWWANIRFEKAFTPELCSLMNRAGCIAVSGGMEVVSDRLLKLMNKGVTIAQAAESAYNLTQNNIMVHAYLMYGFPSQTLQETIDALETVRQMFEEGLIQSAFWHRFAMTVHSPAGIHPEQYGAKHIPVSTGSFANNEIPFTDGQDIDLEMLGQGLRLATFNYMNGLCFDRPVYKWFPERVPKTRVPQDYIRRIHIS